MPPSNSTSEPRSVPSNKMPQTPSRPKISQVNSPSSRTNRARRAKSEPKAEADLAPIFKSDLTSIRGLVTCSICDQLLYEPFTIQCGHTYCYSCLCSWFVPNRRKKTCPECRTIIKQMPAPSFMVKQMVEVFINRAELMPPDESVEQHTNKRAEEVAAVDLDRNGPAGLFRGLFPPGRQELILDEADGVHRCPGCNTEYVGGSACGVCGLLIDDDDFDDDFSGEDLDDLDEIEAELQEEMEDDLAHLPHGAIQNMLAHARHVHYGHFHHNHYPAHGNDTDDDPSLLSDSDDSRLHDNDSESDTGGSMRDFIDTDESPESRREVTPRRYFPSNNRLLVEVTPHGTPRQRQAIEISDDEDNSDDSDEGGPVVNRSRRARAIVDLTDEDSDSNSSDAEDLSSVANRLRDDGWSPLHEIEPEDQDPRESEGQYDSTSYVTGDDESDTETMVGNEEERRRPFSGTDFAPYVGGRFGHQAEDLSEDGRSSVMDEDGDTEMSLSPERREVSVNGNNYDHYSEPRSSRGGSVGTDEYEEPFHRTPYDMEAAGELGDEHAIHDVEESDGEPSDTIHRRQPRSMHRQQVQDHYNPRISQIFANHQHVLREDPALRDLIPGVDYDFDIEGTEDILDLQDESNADHERWVEDLHLSHPRARRQSSQRIGSSRTRTQSPSVTRIISSSTRPSRVSRQYINRSGGRPSVRYHL